MKAQEFFTIGHSTLELDEFRALLAEHGVTHLIDVRKLAGSRRYPQFNADTLEPALTADGVTMLRFEALTGRRPVSKTVPYEINAWWQNRSFHNYADHALSAEFGEAIEALQSAAENGPLAIMCAEAVWWRCHRRIISDYLLAAGETVQHIMGEGPASPAALSEGAVVKANGIITYPAR